ncbi:MAG: glycerophosphodiester phosphodiesterase [Pseudomonadota bacterium]
MKRVFSIFAGLLVLALLVLYLRPAPAPASHIFFGAPDDYGPDIIAHGGGLGHGPPNTLFALDKADEMGADVLEGDVQQTKDGVLILRHDDTLDRTTNLTGLIAEMNWADIKQADAGAHTVLDGVTLAGQGISIPTVESALAAFPDARWNLEIKNDTRAAAYALCQSIVDAGVQDRVLVASFHDGAMDHFRESCPDVATSMSSGEVARFVIAARLGFSRWIKTPAVALQVPVSFEGIDLTHPRILAAARARGFQMHYWTINGEDEIEALLVAGADGIITDYVDRGLAVRDSISAIGNRSPDK